MSIHIPILLSPITELLTKSLAVTKTGTEHPPWILDCTLGGGGHTESLLKAGARVLALDRDAEAVRAAQERLGTWIRSGHLEVRQLAFGHYVKDRPLVGILADLGISSDQLDARERGFGFESDAIPDMRMNRDEGPSAYELIETSTEKDLADLIYQYGEERYSRRIAGSLVRAREKGELPKTCRELAEAIRRAVPGSYRHGRIHPATRTFQALRIAVNTELEQLDSLLQNVILSLSPGGRAAVMSFHSLEDRRVKTRFRQLCRNPHPGEGKWLDLTKKPIDPDETEILGNPRARSAHLRVIEREC